MRTAILILSTATLCCLVSCKKNNDSSGNNNNTPTLAITAISPVHAAGGGTITISGKAFSSIPANDSVKIDGKTATVVSASDTTLVVTVPSLCGSGTVAVTAGGSTANGPLFTYDTVYNVSTFFNNQAQLLLPHGLCTDANGNLYAVDYDGSKIVEITPEGVATTLAGGAGIGHKDGQADTAEFFYHHGICRDVQGNLYITESVNEDVRMLSPSGFVTTLAGGKAGSADGADTAASFSTPLGICLAANGIFYITDYNNKKVRTMTSAGVVGTLVSSSLQSPFGICTDKAGNVLVADRGGYKIYAITPAGVMTTFAGTGYPGKMDGPASTASFNNMYGMCADSSGNFYVVDHDNYVIRKINSAGMVSTIAGSGTRGNADGVGFAASFEDPFFVCADLKGNLYVADNSTIRKLTIQ